MTVLLVTLGVVIVGGVAAVSLGRLDAARVWEYTRLAPLAAFLAPEDATLRLAIGNYYFGEGAYDTEKAERYFREALALDPALHGPHYQLARIYFVRGDFRDAETEIQKELALHPLFGRSHYVRGLIYGYTGRLPEAEAEFEAFLEWDPWSWAGYNDLAWVYFQEGKYAEAREAARTGLTLSPGNPWLLNALGVALLNLEEREEARTVFARALTVIESMDESDWGIAYPGNDPGVYREGFAQMKLALTENLGLLRGGDTVNLRP